MYRYGLRALVGAAASMALLAGTAQATTFSAGVSPHAVGSTAKPQTHTTTLGLSDIDKGIDGNAKAALTTLVDSLPADFMTTLSHYSSCSANVVVHGDNKPKCPDSSVVGSAGGSAYVPSLHFDTTTDQGYIFKIDNSTVKFWVHVSKPIPAGLVAQGKITQGSTPFGPVVTWDLSTFATGAQAGTEVRLNRVDFTFAQGSGAGSKPASSKTSCKRTGRKKGKAKRKGKHCTTSKSKPPTSTTVNYSPFVSTGCSTGKWPFQAQLTFADNTKETLNASVGCTPGSSTSSSTAPSPGGTGPLCPPVCTAGDQSWLYGLSTARTH